MKNYILHGILIIVFTILVAIFIVSLFYKPGIAGASYTDYREIMETKVDTKTTDRIIRSCKNRYNELENKEGRNIERCIRVAFAIMCNESSCGKRYKNNSIFGMQKRYDTQLEAINDFTKTYYKWWYKGTNGAYFYGTPTKKAPTQYCVSETSSGSIGHCPNGRKHFNFFYNLFYGT